MVCAYTEERWDDITAALASLCDQITPVDEILLVIDHNPALLERARATVPGRVTVLPSTGPRGLSGARNTGVEAATGEIVAFLDDDAAAAPDWAGHLLAPYADPDVLGVGGAIEPAWDRGRPGWFPREFDWVVGCTYRGLPEDRAAVRNVIGANMSFRREVILAAGGFRTDLGRVGTRPLGCEETELCIRAAELRPGGVILHEPAAVVRHRVPAGRGTWGYYRSRCWSEGLSKAAVSRHTGADRALSSERAYLTSTLPRALARPFRRPAPGEDRTSPATVAAITLGVAATGAGYVVGRVRGLGAGTGPSRDGA